MNTAPAKPRLVILGSGFASYQLLRTIDRRRFDITVVSARNHFLFTPLLPSTTVGTIEFRSIVEPIRRFTDAITFHLASAVRLEHKEKILTCRSPDDREFALSYDTLVIGVGAKGNTFGIPGAEKYGLPLRELADAQMIRQRIIDVLERANFPGVPPEERKRLLHFVVVGGGPTGVEFSAELHDLLVEDLARKYPASFPDVRITLIEATGSLLNSFDRTLSDYTMKFFRRQHITVMTNHSVQRVEETSLVLTDGSILPYGMIVWSTGNMQNDFVATLPVEKNREQRIVTDSFLRIPAYLDVYAIGDCAIPRDVFMPATGQAAMQQGRYLGKAFTALARGVTIKPFRYRHLGMLAYIGSNRALADLPNVKSKGFATWLFWRSTYLTRLVSVKNKFLVISDWLRTFLFGRDTSRI